MSQVLIRVCNLGFCHLVGYGGEALSPIFSTLEELALHYSGHLADPEREEMLADVLICHLEEELHPVGKAGHDSFLVELKLNLVASKRFMRNLMLDSFIYRRSMFDRYEQYIDRNIN